MVEAVGAAVTRFQPGDEVFGMTIRSFAERASVREAGLVAKPANVSFEQAAAIPVAGITALQGLRDKGRIRDGSRVLVNGAGGGVGSSAVQIAKALGAHVTAVTGPDTVELARSIGADEVVDYTATDFTRQGPAVRPAVRHRRQPLVPRLRAGHGARRRPGDLRRPEGELAGADPATRHGRASVPAGEPDLRPVPGPPGDRRTSRSSGISPRRAACGR